MHKDNLNVLVVMSSNYERTKALLPNTPLLEVAL